MIDFDPQIAAEEWYEQLRSIPDFIDSDCQEFKYDLLEMAEGLESDGLEGSEAFLIAAERFRPILSDLKAETVIVNRGWIQMRRFTQLFSGVLIYYFLYIIMNLFSMILITGILRESSTPELLQLMTYYFFCFHLILILITGILYFSGERIICRYKKFDFNPVQALLGFLLILILAGLNKWLLSTVPNQEILSRFYLTNKITHYTFPLVFIANYLLLYKRYYRYCFLQNEDFTGEYFFSNQNAETDSSKFLSADQIKALKKKGLEDYEILLIGLKRKKLLSFNLNCMNKSFITRASLRTHLLAASGVPFYFISYYLMQSSARLLFSFLQIINNDTIFSLRWTRFYLFIFHLIFVFFIVSLYRRDKYLVRWLERIRIFPLTAGWIFLGTILLALLQHYFYQYSIDLVGSGIENYLSMERIFLVISYSFPLLFSVGFLILFNKFYKETARKSFKFR